MAEQQHPKEKPKRTIPLWFIVLVLLLLGFALFGERGVLQVYKAYLQKTELEEKIADLERSNAQLRQEIDALRNDLKTIENIARRELGMVRPDEQVYQFHTPEAPSLPHRPEDVERDPERGATGRVDTPPDGG